MDHEINDGGGDSRHGSSSPADRTVRNGFCGEIGAPSPECVAPPKCNASVNLLSHHSAPREPTVNGTCVSGNHLSSQDFSEIKSTTCERHGDRQNAQTASPENAGPTISYAVSNSPPAEGAPAGVGRHRWCVPPGERRDPSPSAGIDGDSAGTHRPFPTLTCDCCLGTGRHAHIASRPCSVCHGTGCRAPEDTL
jgi:hypothetical protein